MNSHQGRQSQGIAWEKQTLFSGVSFLGIGQDTGGFRGSQGWGGGGQDPYYLTLGFWRSHPLVPGYSPRGVS